MSSEHKPRDNPGTKDNFWKTQSGSKAKFPGKVLKQNSHSMEVSSLTASKTGQHRRNNSTSFELFTESTQSCWDSSIDDGMNEEPVRRSSSVTRCKNVRTDKPKPILKTYDSKTPIQIPKIVINSKKDPDPKLTKFKKVLDDELTDLSQLRSMAWAGIPADLRPITWKLLLGYLPVVKSKRLPTLERKRAEYQNLVSQYYNGRASNDETWRQIEIDIPRMQPLISIFQQDIVQKAFQRILFIWAIRHPASGYVQGMNDLVTPFFVTYLSEFIPGPSVSDVESFEVSSLSDDTIRGIEADAFWSFNKLLDSIQDNYTFAQPGIQRMVNLLTRVMSRVDSSLHGHLTCHGVQYLQFAFRWMNNLLIRELPLRCVIRLWDTYLSEGATTPRLSKSDTKNSSHNETVVETMVENMGSETPFASSFHLFVCAAFLRFWSKNLLREKDFQGLMLLLQNLPTFHWNENEIKLLVADAYQLKYTFTPHHLIS